MCIGIHWHSNLVCTQTNIRVYQRHGDICLYLDNAEVHSSGESACSPTHFGVCRHGDPACIQTHTLKFNGIVMCVRRQAHSRVQNAHSVHMGPPVVVGHCVKCLTAHMFLGWELQKEI